MTASITTYPDLKQVGHSPPGYRQPSTTCLGRKRLAVCNLEHSVQFYSETIGLAVLKADSPEKRLVGLGAHGDRTVLLELEELPGVQPIRKRSRLGLYHTAFLVPSREALSALVQHLRKHHVYFGSADHEVSEALYLTDPDGLTVEVYADRPRSNWRIKEGWIQGGTEPLRFDLLPTVPLDHWKGAPPGTTIGHVHFYVKDLSEAADFYHYGLGLDLTMDSIPGALFMSAGGYHHHVALNAWAAHSALASATDTRLLFWELVLPNREEIDRVAADMTSAGYAETTSVSGARAFVDSLGLSVALVVAPSNSEFGVDPNFYRSSGRV